MTDGLTTAPGARPHRFGDHTFRTGDRGSLAGLEPFLRIIARRSSLSRLSMRTSFSASAITLGLVRFFEIIGRDPVMKPERLYQTVESRAIVV